MEVSRVNFYGGHKFPISQRDNQNDKVLPGDIVGKVISCLNGMNVFSASLINRLWNQRVAVIFQKKDFAAMENMAHFLASYLNKGLHVEQKHKILELVNFKNVKSVILTTDRKINYFTFVEGVNEVLMQLSDGDMKFLFNSLFAEFKNLKKPKLFYDVIFLSKEYKKLHEDLNLYVKLHNDGNSLKKMVNLMKRGALPTSKTLEILISNFNFYSKLKDILELFIEFGARPTTATLHTTIIDCRDDLNFENILQVLLRAGGVPTTETLNMACDELSLDVLKILMKFDAIPTVETLNTAINSDMKVAYLLGIGVIPTVDTLNSAVKFSSKTTIQKILDNGVVPAKETVKIAKKIVQTKNNSKKIIFCNRGSDHHKQVYKLVKTSSKDNKRAEKLSSKKI
ncbi:MAG: hypothetical protein H0W50_02655 [Parachlamydiaceae bacterium]|nr:hypothetical protein [Parachlamydiaceae bacterium]